MAEEPSIWLRIDRFLSRPWFGDLSLGSICLVVMVLAFVMRGDTEVVSLFGWDVPTVCTWRRITGFGCPGCGLTRSFVLFAHGQWVEAFQVNWLGPPLFLVVASQVPWRAWRVWRRVR